MSHSAPIQPGEAIPLDASRDQHLHVTEGIVYVRTDEHDTVLTPGDSITIPAGAARRVWNAGDLAARVVSSVFPVALAA